MPLPAKQRQPAETTASSSKGGSGSSCDLHEQVRGVVLLLVFIAGCLLTGGHQRWSVEETRRWPIIRVVEIDRI